MRIAVGKFMRGSMPDDKKDKRYEVLDKLIEAGIKNATLRTVELQDGIVISLTLRIEDKECKITR